MYLLIAIDGSLSLQDVDNMGSFSIVEESKGSASSALAGIAKPAEDNHYWIDANAVIQLSARSDETEWVDGFWDMLKKVEPYGYSNLTKQRLKAHLE